MRQEPSAWIAARHVEPPRYKVFCFPYAGGNPAAFMAWQAGLPAGTQVCAWQSPGRGSRIGEDPCHDFGRLLDDAVTAIRPRLDVPSVLFGHSLGAIIAFEVARRCSGIRHLRHLVVSGCMAPLHWPPQRGQRIATLEGQEFVEAVRAYNGTPDELFENEGLLEYFLPLLAADFHVVASYRYRHAPPLDIPMTLLASPADTDVPIERTADWQRECRHTLEVRLFEGDHFFVDQERPAVLTLMSDIIARLQEKPVVPRS